MFQYTIHISKLKDEEAQKQIEEKDSAIALLNDDLTEAQEHSRQLEFDNVGL